MHIRVRLRMLVMFIDVYSVNHAKSRLEGNNQRSEEMGMLERLSMPAVSYCEAQYASKCELDMPSDNLHGRLENLCY